MEAFCSTRPLWKPGEHISKVRGQNDRNYKWSIKLAEGEGFEPPVRLPVRLISSQVPLTTQPPFRAFYIKHLRLNIQNVINHLILQFDTVPMKRNKRAGQKPVWSTTQYSNLIRYIPSGKYFARIRVQGKLIRKSLKTDRISVAKLRLGDFEKEERRNVESRVAAASGKMTFGEAVGTFQERLKADIHLKPRSKEYREERVAALLRSWPGLNERDVRQISRHECLDWAQRFGEKCSPVAFNNTIGTLRMILDKQAIRFR